MSSPTPTSSSRYEHPCTWTGAQMVQRDDWIVRLTPTDNRELRAAMAVAKARSATIPKLTAQDFPLPTLARALGALCEEIIAGRGFALLRSLEIDDLPVKDAALIYWGIGSHMGRGRAQNAQGDMLGHVTDLGLDFRTDNSARGYQTRLRLPFHNDTSDIVALMCLNPAKSGGLSRIVSSAAVYNTVLQRRPDLLAELTTPMCIDRRGENAPGRRPYYVGATFERLNDRLFCRYNRTYIESAQRFPEVPRLTARQIEALDLIDEICNDPLIYLDMTLARGDMQFVNNYTVLHSRTDYEDWPEHDRRRYLLRLWLETGRVEERPASYLDRDADSLDWERDPKPPVFDLSMRRAELAH